MLVEGAKLYVYVEIIRGNTTTHTCHCCCCAPHDAHADSCSALQQTGTMADCSRWVSDSANCWPPGRCLHSQVSICQSPSALKYGRLWSYTADGPVTSVCIHACMVQVMETLAAPCAVPQVDRLHGSMEYHAISGVAAAWLPPTCELCMRVWDSQALQSMLQDDPGVCVSADVPATPH